MQDQVSNRWIVILRRVTRGGVESCMQRLLVGESLTYDEVRQYLIAAFPGWRASFSPRGDGYCGAVTVVYVRRE